ncbi:MAG: DUF881 domain-containing protein [Armatimonadetes bacterium]|nr:DUF881 domain-containing protein [Armatimonadota bacterium]
MSTMLPTVRGKSWVFQVTLLCIVLGALLGLSLRTQRELVSKNMPSRFPALVAAYRAARADNVLLKEEGAKKSKEIDDLQEKLAQGTRGSKEVIEARDAARLLAGTVAVRGPGLVVTINDSPKLKPTETRPDIIEEFMVHDQDIKALVDELCVAGAEAISINGQRRIATTSIRCVGPVVQVNKVELAPPYVIKAVGDPTVLETSLKTQGGPASDLILLDMITVKKEAMIDVPAYTGSTTFYVAKPVAQ